MLRAFAFVLWMCLIRLSSQAKRDFTSHEEEHHKDSNQSSRPLSGSDEITIPHGNTSHEEEHHKDSNPQASRPAFVLTNNSHEEEHKDPEQPSRLLSGKDEEVFPKQGRLKQIICVQNLAAVPKPASSISYKVGAVRTSSKTKTSVREALASLAVKTGFSYVDVVSVEASVSFSLRSSSSRSEMSSSTESETLTLNV